MMHPSLLLLLLTGGALKASSVHADLIFDSLMSSPEQGCTLNCENNGVCEYVPGENYGHQVQSGQLIQRCNCPAGFTGTGCELKVQTCDFNTKTCTNGMPCDSDGRCDCADAEYVSKFAARQCRHPYTEYCQVHYDPKRPLMFCTNGGKCKGSLIAARVAPGDTTVNSKYESAGCVCAPEYYGPHCEFLHHGMLQASKAADKLPEAEPKPEPESTPEPEPEPAADSKAASSSQSIESMMDNLDGGEIDGDNSFSAPSAVSVTQESSSSSSSNGTRKILLSVFGVLIAGGVALAVLVHRHRKQKALRGHALQQQRQCTSRPKSKKVIMKKKPKIASNPQAATPHAGTANLDAFIVDDSDDDDIYTARTDQSGYESCSGSSSWIETISNQLDAFVGPYVVDDDNNVYLVGSDDENASHPFDEAYNQVYMVEDDNDGAMRFDDTTSNTWGAPRQQSFHSDFSVS